MYINFLVHFTVFFFSLLPLLFTSTTWLSPVLLIKLNFKLTNGKNIKRTLSRIFLVQCCLEPQ